MSQRQDISDWNDDVDDARFEFFMKTAPTNPDGSLSAQFAKDIRWPTEEELETIRRDAFYIEMLGE
jgi:hypothetical protein